MIILKIIVTPIFWIGSTILSIILAILALLFSLIDSSGNSSHMCGRIWGRLLVWNAFSRVKVLNPDFIKEIDDPVIWMCNHSSFFDIFGFLGYVPRQFRIVSKEEIFKIPLLGSAMKRAGYISIDAKNPKKAAGGLGQSAQTIRGGKSVLIFPEGSRSRDGVLQKFRRGSFRLAKEAGVPIVVVRIRRAHLVMPPFQKGISRVTPRRMTLKYLGVVPEETVKTLPENDLLNHVHEIMGRE